MVTTNYFTHKDHFKLESGEFLPELTLCYSTMGQLNEDGSNVVWVCHALTGNTNVLDWWSGLFVDGFFDPQEYFIVCANMIGGCYGSTGPLSKEPDGDLPYYSRFPRITNYDIVRAFDLLRESLEIGKIHTIIGGSMGGQQAVEWAVWKPYLFETLVGLATNARHSPWGIAFNESQRMAIANDPTWLNDDDQAGIEGMKTARAVGMLSYRSYGIYESRQLDEIKVKQDFKASSYQQYQGKKLTQRFNAYTYWRLSEAMDAHNVGRNRGSIEEALRAISARSHFIGINSDILFPVQEQEFLAQHVRNSTYDIISSHYGHDGFLVETEKINNVLAQRIKSR